MSHASVLRGGGVSSRESGKGSETLERYATHVFQGASQVFSSLCGRAVLLTFDRLVTGPLSILPPLLPGPWIGMHMRVTKELSGSHLLIWTEADAIALAQCILGEEASETSGLSASRLDALSETAHQIAGALGSSLRAALGRPIALEGGSVFPAASMAELLSMLGQETPASIFVLARVTIEGRTAGKVVLIVSSSLLEEVGQSLLSADAGAKEGEVSTTQASVPPPFAPLLQGEKPGSSKGIDMLLDVNLQVSVELGRTRLPIRDILQLGPGSVVELDKLAGEAVDILVNDKPIAKGEVIIIDENFGVRITSISGLADRIRNLR